MQTQGEDRAVSEDEQGSRLMALAEQVGAKLVARGETVAVAESSAGGLISAALLSVGGASRYFRGGAVVYTKDAKMSFLQIDEKTATEPRASTEAHALVLARNIRKVMGSTWGLGETGATGPTGNRYGDARATPASRWSGRQVSCPATSAPIPSRLASPTAP